MTRSSIGSLALLALAVASVAADEPGDSTLEVTIGADEYLLAGADAIRSGQYDDGIRLTLRGLERAALGTRNRAAGLANLCAAYTAKNEPDNAIPYCTQSLQLNDTNWRAYSNRARAYFVKGMYAEAAADNDKAAQLSPNSAHVQMMTELLNERLLQPQVITEEHH